MNKKESVELIKKNISNWERIENPETLNEFLEWVINVDEKDWNKHEKRIKEVIKDYDDELKKDDVEPEININLEEIKKQSLVEEKYSTNKDKFVKYFSYYSVHNEDIANVFYHNIISILCRICDVKIKSANGKIIAPLSHSFIIQSSGTGKDQAMDFFITIINKLNKKIGNYNLSNPVDKIRNILCYEWSGSETSESLLDGFEIDGKGRAKVKDKVGNPLPPVKGILSKYDIIVSRECSFLFKQKSNNGRLEKSDIMLLALEGRLIPKSLIGWRVDGMQYSTNTVFNGVFVGTSRPVENMKAHLAYSGLQQRGLNICRGIGKDERKVMDDKIKELRCLKNADWVHIERGVDGLVDDFFRMLLFLRSNVPVLVEDSKSLVAELIDKNISEFRIKVFDEIENDEQKEILDSFVSRFHHHVNILACHNAISRFSSIMELVDFQNALSLLSKCFKFLSGWVEKNVDVRVNVRERKEQERRVKLFLFVGKNGRVFEREKLINWCCSSLGVSKAQSYVIVRNWVKDKVLLEKDKLLVFN